MNHHFQTYLHALRQLNRDVRLYLLTAVLIGFVASGIYGVLLNIYLLRLDYDPRFIGTVNAAGQMAFILLSFPAGALSRRWGSRNLIVTGVILHAAGFLLLPLAEYVPISWREGWFISMRLLTSLGGPLYWVNGNLFLMDKTSLVERNHAFSVRTAFFPLAGFVGSLLGGALPSQFANWLQVTVDDPAPYRYALMSGAAVFLLAIPLILRTSKVEGAVSRNQVVGERGRLPYHLFVPLGIIMMMRSVGETAVRDFFNVYMDDRLGVATTQIGAIAAMALLLSVPAALVTPTLAARWGNDRVFAIAMLGMGLCMLPLALITHPLATAVGYVTMLIFAQATKPTLYVYRLEIVSAVWWGIMSGTGGTVHGIGQVIASFGGGYFITWFGYQSFFMLAALITLLGAGYFWLFSRIPRREMATAHSTD